MNLPPNVVLIGFMGSGKTSTGKELAGLLGFGFWDMDQWIEEKNGKKAYEIFEKNGEFFFRDQEREAIKWLNIRTNYVVSSGGGAWIDKENREFLLSRGWCVWLEVSAPEAWNRIKSRLSQRPLLSRAENPLAEIEKMIKKRTPDYSVAHFRVKTDGKSPREVAVEIVKALKEERPFDLPQM